MTWQFNPLAIATLLLTATLIAYVVVAWPWRSQPSTRWYLVLMGCVACFTAVHTLQLLIADYQLIAWLDAVGISFAVLASPISLLFVLSYTRLDHMISWRSVSVILLVPVLYIAFIVTNPVHGSYLQNIRPVMVDGLMYYDGDLVFSPFLIIGLLYLLSMQLAAILTLLRALGRAPAHIQKQYATIGLTIGIVLGASIIDLLGINKSMVSTYIIALMLAAFPMGWSLLRYRLLDLTPAALDAIFKSIQDAVFILDRSDRVMDANPAAERLLSLPLATILGQRAELLLGSMNDTLQRLKLTPDIHQEVRMGHGPDARIFDLRLSPLHSQHDRVVGRVAVVREVTDTRQAAQRALALQLQQQRVELLQTFVRDTSHDLKTPLSLIRSSSYLLNKYADRLEQQLASGAAVQDTLTALRDKSANIDRSAEHLHKMLDSMLEMVRIDQQDAPDIADTDFKALVERAAAPLRAQAEARGLTLRIALDDCLPSMALDRELVQSAICHVVENAIAFTDRGGCVTVATMCTPDTLDVVVADTGVGIAPEHLPRVFERFYRVDKARAMEQGGLGLGLTIARKIVEAHGGQITVESQPGIGSTFRLRFPRDRAQVLAGRSPSSLVLTP